MQVEGNSINARVAADLSPEDILEKRRRFLGENLSLAYRDPLHLVRGAQQYLWDARGRRYLDAYNNVPHVGHCNPRVLEAMRRQQAELNTNTRYLHESLTEYAERLGAMLPGSLSVCYFVNSGSEANELALRLARAHTRKRNLIVLEHAYHGNTTTMVDISPYKHAGPGGEGAPSWVHVAPLPDAYRGLYRGHDATVGLRYASHVERLTNDLRSAGGLAGFIAESWPSVGGQMPLPPGYLPAVYDSVRQAGGVCIADEVQTGYGRLGAHFWGFQFYDAVPDIVVLGKPIGNGYPLGAVATTPEIARSFNNGMEFFSTFGGSTVSCATGLAVLDVVTDERLQDHASHVGEYLLTGLRKLRDRYSLVGDVRGAGLFLGVELVLDRTSLEPATAQTAAIVNGLRDRGILTGKEGPHDNIIKIRPPMPFSRVDAEFFLEMLELELKSQC